MDAASGVDASTCELRVQEDDGGWQPFSTACAGDEVHSQAQPGHVYTFRLSASDHVSNTASTEALARFPRVTKYYYHGGQRVAMRADGVVYYLHGDHLGSTSLTTDASGAVVARQLYHPYGTVRAHQGTLPTDFGFTGQRDVPGTGLVFMHARYYHAGLGRFTQADTIVPNVANPQEWNRYGYCLNNPTRYIDPSGHQQEPSQYRPEGIVSGGTTGPYVLSSATTVQYSLAYGPPTPPWIIEQQRAARIERIQDDIALGVNAFSLLVNGIGGPVAAAYSVPAADSPQSGKGVSYGGLYYSPQQVGMAAAVEEETRWLFPVPPRYRDSVAGVFDDIGTVETLEENLFAYRHWGGDAKESGSPWFSEKMYIRSGNARRYLALPNGNTAEHISLFMIPAGTTIIRGKVASQVGASMFGPYAAGRGTQIYLPDPNVAVLLEQIR